MTRIFEALEQVATERSSQPNIFEFPGAAEDQYGSQIRAKMRELYRVISLHCPGDTGQIVQLIGPRPGVGTSRLIRTLARVCDESLNKSVLIIDTDSASPQFSHFSIEPLQTWVDALHRGASPESVLYRVRHSGLHLIKAFRDQQTAATLLDSPRLAENIADLRQSFDLILLDSTAADVAQDGLEMATIVDGTILVVEAETTRWQVAESVKQRIEARGGNVIGVLLNGLQFHIPAALYSRL